MAGPWEDDQTEPAPGSGQHVAKPEHPWRKEATPVIPQWPLLYPQTPRLGTEPPFQDAMDTELTLTQTRGEGSQLMLGARLHLRAPGTPVECSLPPSEPIDRLPECESLVLADR